MSTTALRRRPARVVPAGIVALLIIVSGAALLVLASLRLQSGSWPEVATALTGTGDLRWGSPLIAAVGGVAAVAGIVLLVCAILPGSPSNRAAQTAGATAEAVVTRRGAERLVEHRVGAVDGVGSCRARLRGQRLSVVVRTPLRGHTELAATVRDAADGVLRHALAGRTPRTTVRMVSSS